MYEFNYQLFDKNPAKGGSKIDEQSITLKDDQRFGDLYDFDEKWRDYFKDGNTLCIKDGNDYVTVSYDDYEDIRFIVKPSVLMVYPKEILVEKEISRNPIFISDLNPFEWNSTLLKEQGDYAKQQIHNYYTDAMIELVVED
ncbi:hypothetical protein SNEBB_007158 [Seison nebaliae]|nr:hypothetical protein SNEBB_007158 [Seison nebaliae]